LRSVFNKNVPVGVRCFLSNHQVRTFDEMQWHPQLENGGLLQAAEASGFDVMITCQNIKHQKNSRAGVSPWAATAEIAVEP
jgi:hypothetical protein